MHKYTEIVLKIQELISLLKDKFSVQLIYKIYVFFFLFQSNNRHVNLSKRNEHIKTRKNHSEHKAKFV